MDRRYQYAEELAATVLTQGSTSTPSIISVKLLRKRKPFPHRFAFGVRVVDLEGVAAATNATIAAVSGWGSVLTTHTATKDLEFVSALPAQATSIFTLTDVIAQGELLVTGNRTYEVDAGGGVTPGNVPIDVSATAIKATGTLTIAEDVTAGDAFKVDTKTYIVVAEGTAAFDGEIDEGPDEATFKLNCVAAINGTDGINDPHPSVTASAFAGDICTLTAKIGGVAGNAIATVEVGQGFTHVSNVFGAVTLENGVDPTATEAEAAIILAINGDPQREVTAAAGAGTTVGVTANASYWKGAHGNSIITTTTFANGTWTAGTLAGGIDDNNDEIRFSVTNAQAETITLLFGPARLLTPSCSFVDCSLDVTHAV